MDDKNVADLMSAIKDGLRQAVRDRLMSNYGESPFARALNDVVGDQAGTLRELLVSSLTLALGDPAFRVEIAAAVRTRLAKILVERFGGELEKQVNTLKSDPTTRARLTLAIQEIVAGATKV